MNDLLSLLVLMPWDSIPPGSPSPTSNLVYPQQGNGFAAGIVGAFFGLGLLVIVMIFISVRPKRTIHRNTDPNNPRPRPPDLPDPKR